MTVAIKRVYEDPATDDGFRVLVDRLWPRGVKKADAARKAVAKEAANWERLSAAISQIVRAV